MEEPMNVQHTTATTTVPEPRRVYKWGLIVGSAVLLLGLTAPAAFAGAPTRQALDLPDVIEIPAGDACDFPLRLDILVNFEVNTTYESRGDETWIRTTGRLIVGVTNEWNGHSVVVNISGPGLTVIHADGSATTYYYGRSLPFPDGGFFVSSGPVIQEFAADGALTDTSSPIGFARDMCAELG
jgi:hypothetical protein